ncbi:hypothetical protein C8Q80DRAFT_1053101, partial [Daedaleopsis nitida]
NPDQAQCPDFTSAFFEDMRNALIQANGAVDHDGAVASLTASWADKNTRDKERWDEQEARQQVRGPQPGEQAPGEQVPAEQDPVHKTAGKKQLPPVKRGVKPSEVIMDQPAPFAINKLKELSYCDLWYFAPEARKLATELLFTNNEDALTLTRTDNALVLASSARSSKNVKRDEELSWEQVCVASTVMLCWASRLSWPDEHLKILNTFYYKLQGHPMRSEPDGTSALVLYQAKYRRDWHRALESDDEVFNLSAINEDTLRFIRREL